MYIAFKMSAYPDGESAIDVRTFLHRIAKSARMFEHFDVGAEGAALARSVCDFVQRKRVEHVLADTELRDRMYAKGREVWARMCATYDRLPADFPFRYVELDNEWLRLYVVFDGLTVVGDNVNKFGYYHLEAQDDAHRGWIGVRGNFGGRGACMPEGEAPIACALKEMIPGGMREFLNKMFILSTRGCRSSAILERYCREIQTTLSRMSKTVASLKHIRRVVLTDYVDGQKMVDLERSVEEAGVNPSASPAGAPTTGTR